jgi:hypothetical protein
MNSDLKPQHEQHVLSLPGAKARSCDLYSLLPLSLFLLLVPSSGCITCAVRDKAAAQTHQEDCGKVIVDQKPRLAYYALLPLSFPADVATSPIQAVYFGVMLHAMFQPPSQ